MCGKKTGKLLPDLIKMIFFGQKVMEAISENKDTIGKSISRGTEFGANFSFVAPSTLE